MGSQSCDFGRHFHDAAGKIDSCGQSFGKAEPLECVRVSRDSISRMWIFSERLSEMWTKTRAFFFSTELRPWVELRSPIVTLWGTRWRARAAAKAMRVRERRVQDRCEQVLRVMEYAIVHLHSQTVQCQNSGLCHDLWSKNCNGREVENCQSSAPTI